MMDRRGKLILLWALAGTGLVLHGWAGRTAAVGGVRPEPPPAMVEGDRIEWSDLQPVMAETVGGQVLEELALGRLLKSEVGRHAISVGQREIEQERLQLGRSLAAAAGLGDAEGPELIEKVRRGRGLGDLRFAALLERNAMLRALVRAGEAGAIEISDEDVKTAYTLKHGSRVQGRVLVVRTDAEAKAALARLGIASQGEPIVGPMAETFGEIAAAVSLDPSRERGGLLPPISLADANYPVAVRDALGQMRIGEIRGPIAVTWGGQGDATQQGFAVVRLEAEFPASADAPKQEDVADTLKAEIRMVRERALMDRLGTRLIKEARITVFDRTLGKSWDAWRGVEN